MNNVVKIALVGGGAYFLYQAWASSQVPVAASALPPVGSTPAVTTAVPAAPAAPAAPVAVPVSSNPLRAQLVALAAPRNGLLNIDEWNYYLHQLNPAKDLEVDPRNPANSLIVSAINALGANASGSITVDQYLAAIQSAGLAGYRRGRGMGANGAVRPIPVPIVLSPQAYRQAGRRVLGSRNYIRTSDLRAASMGGAR